MHLRGGTATIQSAGNCEEPRLLTTERTWYITEDMLIKNQRFT